jgi:hypothetical protein
VALAAFVSVRPSAQRKLFGGAIEHIVYECAIGDEPKLEVNRDDARGHAEVVLGQVDDLARLSRSPRGCAPPAAGMSARLFEYDVPAACPARPGR